MEVACGWVAVAYDWVVAAYGLEAAAYGWVAAAYDSAEEEEVALRSWERRASYQRPSLEAVVVV